MSSLRSRHPYDLLPTYGRTKIRLMSSTTNFKGGSASAQRGEVWSPEEYGYLLFPKETKL